jgi:hypothetical protein
MTDEKKQVLAARRRARYFRRQAKQTYELDLRVSQTLWHLYRAAANQADSVRYKLAAL